MSEASYKLTEPNYTANPSNGNHSTSGADRDFPLTAGLNMMGTDDATQPLDSSAGRHRKALSHYLPSLLRITGIIGVVGSIFAILLQGWNIDSDINRFYKLLAETATLTVAGLFMSYILREFKSARVFFGLALCSGIANFTILGALIYSIQPHAIVSGTIPSHALWQIPSSANIALLAGLTISLLTVIAAFSYSVFSRGNAKALTIGLLSTSSLILIPWRETEISALIALAATIFAVSTVLFIKRKGQFSKTKEHFFALATLFIPAGVILGRTFYLYDPAAITLLVIASIVYAMATLLLWEIGSSYNDGYWNLSRTTTATILKLMRFAASWAVVFTVIDIAALEPGIFMAVLVTIIVGMLAIRISSSAANSAHHSMNGDSIDNFTATLNAIAVFIVWILLCNPMSELLNALVLCLAGAAMLWQQMRCASKSGVKLAIALLAYAVLGIIFSLITAINFNSWLTLAASGIGLIIIASLWEKPVVRENLARLKRRTMEPRVR